jgi:hypothetical protein
MWRWWVRGGLLQQCREPSRKPDELSLLFANTYVLARLRDAGASQNPA